MNFNFKGIFAAAFILLCGAFSRAADTKIFIDKIEPVLETFCYDCHGDGADKGDFAMDDYDSLEKHFTDMAVWFEVWKNIRGNLMPPADKKQLNESQKKEVLAFIERAVFKIDPK